jgi:hypothetical protein
MKRIRKNIFELKNNYPDEFGRFIMALDLMQKSDDWERICGIHGLTFNIFDKKILCPKDSSTVSRITGIGEPQYCPHGVKQFLIWHTIYLLEFEFLLNKYNKSINRDFISLPWLDVPNMNNDDYNFMSTINITIQYDSSIITIPNPLIGGRIFKDGFEQKTKRNGYLNPKTKSQKNQMSAAKIQLDNTLLISNYESLSSSDIPRKRMTIINTTPLEAPHNTCHTTLGGSGGSMSTITTAAHDPIFWFHHCNIDRYFYNWFIKITNNFTKQMTVNEILPETLNLMLTPFFTTQINLLFTDSFNDYKYCWENNTKTYLKISDVIDLSRYNYTYEVIEVKQKLMWEPKYFELIGIPIPRESCDIKLFIVPININFNQINFEQKETYFAGSGCWNGINRNEIQCDRCEKTRTNISINISDYLLENNINKKNISKYNLIIEGYGLGIENLDGTFNTYSHEQILCDGKYILILDSDDIIANREFKFEKKYLHTKLIQGIIHKLNKLGYIIEDITNWDEILSVVTKFQSDWGINFNNLIKMKITDKLNIANTDNKIYLLKDLFIKNYNTKNELEINYVIEGFNEYFTSKIFICIDEWVRLFNSKSLQVKFNQINSIDAINIPNIIFRFVQIDGDYGICGDTYIKDNNIIIDIDSEENFSIEGLFELIVKHELGHAFGLSHNSNQESIMYPFVSDLTKKVLLEDITNILEK